MSQSGAPMAYLERLLECVVCLDRFQTPKILPCQHTFCAHCLSGLVHGQRPSVRCPTCRAVHKVPKEGFPNNLTITALLDLPATACPPEKASGGPASPKPCAECGTVSVLSSCLHCERTLCLTCRQCHKQHMHDTVQGDLRDLRHTIGNLSSGLEKIQSQTLTVTTQANSLNTLIWDTIERYCRELRQCGAGLTEHADRVFGHRLRGLTEHQEKLRRRINEIKHFHKSTSMKLKQTSLHELTDTDLSEMMQESARFLGKALPILHRTREKRSHSASNRGRPRRSIDAGAVSPQRQAMKRLQSAPDLAPQQSSGDTPRFQGGTNSREAVVNREDDTATTLSGDATEGAAVAITVMATTAASDLEEHRTAGRDTRPITMTTQETTLPVATVTRQPVTLATRVDPPESSMASQGPSFMIGPPDESSLTQEGQLPSRTSPALTLGDPTVLDQGISSIAEHRPLITQGSTVWAQAGLNQAQDGPSMMAHNPQGVVRYNTQMLMSGAPQGGYGVPLIGSEVSAEAGFEAVETAGMASGLARSLAETVQLAGLEPMDTTDSSIVSLGLGCGAERPGSSLSLSEHGGGYKQLMIKAVIGKRGPRSWSPSALCVSPTNGTIIVLDSYKNLGQVLDSDGHFVTLFGAGGATDGKFDYPSSCTCDGDGNIVITDTFNHRVQILDRFGSFVRKFGHVGSENGALEGPHGVAVDEAGGGLFYVADTNNCRIQVHTSAGQYVRTLGGPHCLPANMLKPRYTCVTVSRCSGDVYVSDGKNHCVHQFGGPSGQYVRSIGRHGGGLGEFSSPRGLCVDASERLWVADRDNHRVQVFDAQGEFLYGFGSQGERGGQFQGPEGIALAPNGDIVVAECGGQRIQIFTEL